jgi:hypothetical protein
VKKTLIYLFIVWEVRLYENSVGFMKGVKAHTRNTTPTVAEEEILYNATQYTDINQSNLPKFERFGNLH